jgi:MoaA/NifB/PqqE/SkfB family radical SAM enzyme
MRSHELKKALLRGPMLAWDVFVRGRYAFKYDQMPMLAGGMSAVKRINLFKSGANLLHRRLIPWSMPLHMQFELTNYCNLRCPVCPAGSGSLKRTARAMNVELFERVMDEVGPFLLTASLWAWGEPLLHPRLKDMLRIARKYDVITLLSTNGQVLNNERVLDALIDEPPAYLIVAFDGLNDETNSVYRVGARIAPILEGVQRLAEIKRARGLQRPVLNMRFIVMKHNQHEVPHLEEFAVQHGFELLSIRNIFFIESTSDDQTTGRLAPDDKGWSSCGYAAERSTSPGAFICMEPFWFPTLFSDGGVVLCEQDYNAQLALGRVGVDGAFRELWFSKKAAALRKTIRDDMANLSCCRKCPYTDRPATDFNVAVRSLKDA